MKAQVTQSCPTLCHTMDLIVHGILQARVLEWVAFPFSRGSSQPRERTWISRVAGGFFTSWATREAHFCEKQWQWAGLKTIGLATLENSVVVPQKFKSRVVKWSSNSSSVYILRRIESRVSIRYLSVCVQGSVIHDSLEAAQMNKMWYVNTMDIIQH